METKLSAWIAIVAILAVGLVLLVLPSDQPTTDEIEPKPVVDKTQTETQTEPKTEQTEPEPVEEPEPEPEPETEPVVKGKVVQFVEFGDLQCPFCKAAFPTIKRLKEEYGDRLNVTFKHFPIRAIHSYAQKAAEAAECARDQGKFWEYHDLIYGTEYAQAALDVPSLKQYAGFLGLETKTFNSCLDSGEKELIVEMDLQEGLRLGVDGTPGIFIDGKKIIGAEPYEIYKKAIDAALAA